MRISDWSSDVCSSDLYEIFRVHPELGFDMTWLGAKEEEALDGHLLALGRRKADERIVHFALYLFHRGGQTGLSRKNTLEIPVPQSPLADSPGISLVNTNKTRQSPRTRPPSAYHTTTNTIPQPT